MKIAEWVKEWTASSQVDRCKKVMHGEGDWMKYIKGCEVRNKQPEMNGKIQIDLMFVYVEKTKLFRN